VGAGKGKNSKAAFKIEKEKGRKEYSASTLPSLLGYALFAGDQGQDSHADHVPY
jgi:hypothetical protein